MAAALRACGWLYLRGRRPTNALAERLRCVRSGEAEEGMQNFAGEWG